MFWLFVSVAVALFAIFPLTDTDIWWHLACAREWVTTWTPVREPVVNVHDYFQQAVALVYNLGGAPLLVAFKAILWATVFALFLHGMKFCGGCLNCRVEYHEFRHDVENAMGKKRPLAILFAIAGASVILFVFRFQFEMRPVLFSLLFLGIYWNVLPWLVEGRIENPPFRYDEQRGFCRCASIPYDLKKISALILILVLQWFWCKCQGLYILGPLFALLVLASELLNMRLNEMQIECKWLLARLAFVVALFAMPFLHCDGVNLFLYPFGLLERLLGFSPSAAIFASEIAENRSPVTLLMNGENVLQSVLMIVLCAIGVWLSCSLLRSLYFSLRKIEGRKTISRQFVCNISLVVTAILALVAERNFVLFLPVFFAACGSQLRSDTFHLSSKFYQISSKLRFLPASYIVLPALIVAFLLGLWAKSLASYDHSMVAFQRVPVAATAWMLEHSHPGRLFNDDRAGGYLAFMNPSDSTFIDGRFILKTAEFFERYLAYAKEPNLFLRDADSLRIDRVVLPLLYYTRWDKLVMTLDSSEKWHIAYRDSFYAVIDRTKY